LIFIVAPSRVDTNPKGVVGHAALYVTSPVGNAGVSTYGDFDFRAGVEGFTRGYVEQGREVKMYVLTTTTDQDAKMVNFMKANPEGNIDRNASIMKENCAGACVNILHAGGVVAPDDNPASFFFVSNTPNSLEENLESGSLSGKVSATVTFPAEDPQPHQASTAPCPEGQLPNRSGGCS
jgi:hypothetical protein